MVNVSAWKDVDEEGRRYRDYFTAAASHSITNFRAGARGWQGQPGEIFLDLEAPLSPELKARFDVVLNRTTLEHVHQVQRASINWCDLSRDVVLLVVRILQPYHGSRGDDWRYSPLLLQRFF